MQEGSPLGCRLHDEGGVTYSVGVGRWQHDGVQHAQTEQSGSTGTTDGKLSWKDASAIASGNLE